ncbi:LOW QUALITY PROTEIN: hypothetical protein FGSG_13335 [Fusarium graminearum PH-1]|uniref:hypothetical protein n=1 Tax=Gibberella zeae (strain ATCC MYA-4620 / CBS 123657 / FGSC 9075 / NRRL 31084 / PH-1) TaxID=229533 RepID=UPI00021F1CB7|nr:LOW QUALITY PROTEIN: hypothetical protein FGSG_13335 [Fusarium graminearum PH-1]ESU14722.1 LOW QUALITY PROTEIN: hypothetical protein FGSG_13335 [Fusarium graminearum PH-1]|eukprot:XP_011320147.1 LOW QUALITY PROTEIN: hypothetical protein FGSG_13335 [Fusarium graminearum PH-1]
MYKGTTGMSRSWGNKLAKGRILNMRAQQQGDSGYDAERRGFAIDARSVNENFRAMQTLTWSSARQMLHTVYVQAINISQYTYSHCSLMSASSLTLRLSFLPYDLLAPNTVFIIKVLSHIPRLWALTSASANGNAPMISKSRSATESISSTYGSAYDERCVLEHSIRSEYEDKTSETLPISVTTWRPDSPHDSRYRVKTSHDLEKKISTPCYAPGLLNKTLVPTNLRDLDNIGLTDVIP